MTDAEIVAGLAKERGRLTPYELVALLRKLTGGKLSQGAIITHFKRAFPESPPPPTDKLPK